MPFDAVAQSDYPNKPVRLIVPFAPGGGTDIVARVMAQKVGEIFKQSVVIDNRGGAGGVIGMEMAVRATPDGYTLGIVSGSIATTAAQQSREMKERFELDGLNAPEVGTAYFNQVLQRDLAKWAKVVKVKGLKLGNRFAALMN